MRSLIILFFILFEQIIAGSCIKNKNAENIQLNLMFKSFVYDGDLQDAYQTALSALRIYPHSIVWQNNAAQIAIWMGKTKEAINHWQVVYYLKKDPVIRRKILNYMLASYQYTKAIPLAKDSLKASWNRKNIKLLVYLYGQVGEPEKAVNILYKAYEKPPHDEYWLIRALQLSIQMGDIGRAKKFVTLLQNDRTITAYKAQLLAYYYFLNRDLNKAFSMLAKVPLREIKGKSASSQLMQRSDLGWQVGAYRASAMASEALIKRGNGRLVDYERLLTVVTPSNPKRAQKIAKRGFLKFQKPYLFFTYASLALRNKDSLDIQNTMNEIESNSTFYHLFKNNAQYWLVKAKVAYEDSNLDYSKYALFTAMRLSPNNDQVKVELLWFLIDNKMDSALKKTLVEFSRQRTDSAMWLPMISGYMRLQDIDRANFYMQKLKKSKRLDIDMTYAYLLQAQERNSAFMQRIMKIWSELENEIANNRLLLKNKKFLDKYLNVGIFLCNPDDFAQMLKSAKPYLKHSDYENLQLFWYIKNKAYAAAKRLWHDGQKHPQWMNLSLALHFEDMPRIQKIIYKYTDILPIRDRVDAADIDGQKALAQTLAFKGLEKNSDDYLMYYQMRQLFENTEDQYKISVNYDNEDILSRYITHLENRNDIGNGWEIYENISQINNTSWKSPLKNIHSNELKADIRLHKYFDRGSIDIKGGWRNAMKNYLTLSIGGMVKLDSRWKLHARVGLHDDTDDSTYLLIGGYKDNLRFDSDYELLPSTTINMFASLNRYSAQDHTYLGGGKKIGINTFTILRTGYPDIEVSLSSEYGTFSSNGRSAGILNDIMLFPDDPLPKDYFNIGSGIYYGYQNYQYYVRDWRPYFGLNPSVDILNGDFFMGFDAGIGGALTYQDHLNIGLRYTPAINQNQEARSQLYLQYKMLY